MLFRSERAVAARFSGGLQVRIVVEFLVSTVAWTTVLVLGVAGTIPLWLGLVLNSIVAATFYMPMHEAAHGNVTGRPKGQRRLDDAIGVLCSIPVGLSYTVHRSSHLRHHAFTNDPDRDPDRFTAGSLAEIPAKWLVQVMILTFLIFWVRFTFPRFREDQLQKLAWKFLIPIALLNIAATDRKSTRLNSSHIPLSRMPSSA